MVQLTDQHSPCLTRAADSCVTQCLRGLTDTVASTNVAHKCPAVVPSCTCSPPCQSGKPQHQPWATSPASHAVRQASQHMMASSSPASHGLATPALEHQCRHAKTLSTSRMRLSRMWRTVCVLARRLARGWHCRASNAGSCRACSQACTGGFGV
jgi:hypothetical protein